MADKFPYSWLGHTDLYFNVTVHKMTFSGSYGQKHYFQVQSVSCVSTDHEKAPARTLDLWDENVRSVDGTTRKQFEEALMHAMFTSPFVTPDDYSVYGNGGLHIPLSKRPDTSPDYYSWIKNEDGHGVRSYFFWGTKKGVMGRVSKFWEAVVEHGG